MSANGLNHHPLMPKGQLRAPWSLPNREVEHEHVFTVTIRAFGHADKTLVEAARALAIAMHRIDSTDGWSIVTADGRSVVFDHWAQDGNHAGHDRPLVIEEPH